MAEGETGLPSAGEEAVDCVCGGESGAVACVERGGDSNAVGAVGDDTGRPTWEGAAMATYGERGEAVVAPPSASDGETALS